MTIEEMHYDFKRKVNKNDSNQNRNFLIPEIDLALNEAQELFVKWIAEPRMKNHLGVETTQRTIDDLRTIIVHDHLLIRNLTYSETFDIPANYWYYLSGAAYMTKGDCSKVKAGVVVQRHNDLFEEDIFSKSSFEWREVNIVFYEHGIKYFTDNIFSVDSMNISYIRKPRFIHNADGFIGNQYFLPGATVALTGTSDCELPEQVHSEIVDIAAMLVSGNIASPEFELKMAKLKLNEIK
jgi:hypothetical protein